MRLKWVPEVIVVLQLLHVYEAWGSQLKLPITLLSPSVRLHIRGFVCNLACTKFSCLGLPPSFTKQLFKKVLSINEDVA